MFPKIDLLVKRLALLVLDLYNNTDPLAITKAIIPLHNIFRMLEMYHNDFWPADNQDKTMPTKIWHTDIKEAIRLSIDAAFGMNPEGLNELEAYMYAHEIFAKDIQDCLKELAIGEFNPKEEFHMITKIFLEELAKNLEEKK